MSISAKTSKSRVRRRLLTSGAVASAIVALMLSPDARAQAVNPNFAAQGTPVVNSGGVVITRAPTVDTVRVNTSEAVVTWTPFDTTGTGTINFLPQGTQLAFIGVDNFTILNRIIPVDANSLPVARMIALNGLVTSAIANGQQPGGSVWFYSPGGILVGGTSVINVGSLVLTTRDIDTTGGLFGSNGEIRFRDPAIAANGTIEISSAARISATTLDPGGAYIAMVAPRIVQAGTVNADGSVALVAAEQADIRINQGLFDINVLVGSSDAHGIEHSGTTGGASDISPTNDNRVYMVAIPKNQAMTMLLSGNVGHQTPTSATVNANGGIVLSAGRNIVNGQIAGNAPGTGTGNISITDSIFRNDLVASATGAITGRPNESCAPFFCSAFSPSGQIRFNGNARFAADQSVSLSVGQAQQIIAVGDLELTSGRPGVGGSVSLTIDNAAPPSNSTTGGGFISVGNSLLLDASARGDTSVANGAAIGGTATLSVTNGLLRANFVDVLANAAGGLTAAGNGASGTGGTALVTAAGGVGTIETAAMRISANGSGGSEGVDGQQNPLLAAIGGLGQGGTARLLANGTRVSSSSFISVEANGTGGAGATTSGDGRGGSAFVDVLGALSTQSLIVQARGAGGGTGFSPFSQGFVESANGGDGYGGNASFVNNAFNLSQLTVGNISVDAGARGGSASRIANGQAPVGGDAFGGNAAATFANSSETVDFLSLNANAVGGDATAANGVGGNANGGIANLSVQTNATLSGQFLSISSTGRGGGGPVAGNGTGGLSELEIESGSAALAMSTIELSADGVGGGDGFSQSSAPTPVIGGDGSGGTIRVNSVGQLAVGQFEASASGKGSNGVATTGGPAPRGGDGVGGSVELLFTSGTATLASLTANTDGIGGAASNSTSGQDGNATGGQIVFGANGFTSVTVEDLLTLSAAGVGNGGSGSGGSLTGGEITVELFGPDTIVTVNGSSNFDASARATSRFGSLVTGGQSLGGNIFVRTASGGTFRSNLIDFSTDASSFSVSGTAGDAFAGQVIIDAFSGGSFEVTGTGVSRISSIADAGSGSTGGAATGGFVQLTAEGGTVSLAGITSIDASGFSGSSSTGTPSPLGARGGAVTIRSSADETSVLNFANLGMATNAGYSGNFASAAFALPFTGGGSAQPGNATGGTVNFFIDGGTVTGQSVSMNADAQGTNAGIGSGGQLFFIQRGGDATIANVFATATGQGGTSLPGQQGGFGIGGTVTVLFSGGNFTGNSFNFNSAGFGGSGISSFASGEGDVFEPGDGGEGEGGSIGVLFNGNATVTIDSMGFSSFGQGGDGGHFDSFSGDEYLTPGLGGTGRGGTVNVNLVSGEVNAEIFAAANAEGGAGGRLFVGGEGQPSFVGSANDPAPSGGFAVGGAATVTLAGATGSSGFTIDTSALGGRGGRTLAGASGGSAQGGRSTLVIDGLNASQPSVQLISRGEGGDGANGFHGAGGNGGTGVGGEVALVIRGASGAATIDGAAFDNIGRGGNGGDGRVDNDFAPVERGFDGGNGGEGVGGTISLTAVDGELLLTDSGGEGFGVTLSTSGFGGDGGNGADNNSGNPLVPTFGGNAGFGGGGRGGQIRLTANGGTIRTDDGVPLFLAAVGEGSNTLASGGAGNVTSTTDPMTGVTTFFGGNGFSTFGSFSVGGTVTLMALDGEGGPGLIDLDDLSINVSGSFAGRVELLDEAAGAGIALGSLSINNFGAPFIGGNFDQFGSGVYIHSRDGAITIDNGLSLDIQGDFQVDAFGTGGLDVTGGLDIIASNSVTTRHEGREGDGRTIEADSISIRADRIDFQSGSNGVANAGSMTLSANSEILFDQIRSDGGNVELTSGGLIFGNSASAAGDLIANSGSSTIIGGANAGNNVIVDAGGNIQIFNLTTAGGYAQLTGNGVDVSSGDIATTFTVRSGDDVTLGLVGGSETPSLGVTSGGFADIEAVGDIAVVGLTTSGAGVNSSSPAAAIRLQAGGIVSTGALQSADNIIINADQMALIGGINPPASVIEAAGALIIDTAEAAIFGSASGQSITINAGGNVIYDSTFSFDDTRITSGAGISGRTTDTDDGDAILRAVGTIDLTGANVGDVLSLTSTAGNVRLFGSTSGYDTVISAAGDALLVSSRTTDIGETAPTTTANIVVNAGGNVELGTLNSAENIFVTAASISGPESDITAALGVNLTTTGNMVFGSVDAGTVFADAGGSIAFGFTLTSGFTSLSADTGITGGTAESETSSVNIFTSAGDISVVNVLAGNGASLVANTGNVSAELIRGGLGGIGVFAGANARVNNANSGAGFSVSAGGSALIGATTSVGDSTVDAGDDIFVTSMTTTGQNVSQSSASANGAIRLFADGAVTLGLLNAIGEVEIDALSIGGSPLPGAPASSIRAGENALITTGEDVDVDSITALRLDVASGGSVDIGTSITSSWTRIIADDDISAASLTSTNASLVLTSRAGSIDVGATRSDGSSLFNAAGGIDLGTVTTRFGDVSIAAGQDASIGSASIGGSLFVFAGDDATLNSATTGGFIIVNAGDEIVAGELTTTGIITGGTEDFPPFDTGGEGGGNTGGEGGGEGDGDGGGGEGPTFSFASILLTSGGATTVGSLDSAGGVVISAASLAGTNSAIKAVDTIGITTAGDAVFESATSGGDTTVDAMGRIDAGNIAAGGSVSNSSAPGSNASIRLTAGSGITFDGLSADNAVIVSGTGVSGSEGLIVAGGMVDITATDGAAQLGDVIGGSIAIDATRAVTFGSLSGGSFVDVAAGDNVTGNEISSDGDIDVLSTGGSISIDRLIAFDEISLLARGGSVSGDFAQSVTGSIVIRAGSVNFGELFANDVIDIEASGNVDLDFGQTGGEGCFFFSCSEGSPDQGGVALTPTGDDILIQAGGVVTLGELDAADNIVIEAASLAGGTSELLAGDRITVTTSGNAVFGSMVAEDGIALTAGGSANGQSATTTRSAAGLSLAAANGLTMGAVTAAGTATLTASAGAVTVANLRSTGAVNASGQSIAITGNGALDFATLNATQGNASVRMASGNLIVRDGRATGTLALTGDAGSIETRGLQAAAITLTSSQMVTLNGSTTASGMLGVTSRGFTNVNGIASGGTVRITSGNIAIGANGRVGTAGTTTSLLLINGDGSARTFVGGDDTTAGYSLSAAEMLRLFANDITIRAPRASINDSRVTSIDTALIGSSRAPDVVIGAFTLNGGAASGGNLGSAGTLRIETFGSARVTGAAVLNSVASGNRFAIVADEAIEVILGSGSIRMNGANGLAGTLSLESDDVVVATSSAIADVAGLTDSAAIDERLAQNDGITSEDGAIAAGSIAIAAGNNVYIQNSGASDSLDARRGFTAGVGGLSITLGESSPSNPSTGNPATGSPGTSSGSGRIVINGRIANEAGGFLTGIDTFDRVTVNGVTLGRMTSAIPGIDIGSTLNGCEIFNTVLCSFIPSGPPIQDNPLVDQDDPESEASEDSILLPGLITLKDLAPLLTEPLVDDPVTGSGNDDLWSIESDDEEEEEAPPPAG